MNGFRHTERDRANFGFAVAVTSAFAFLGQHDPASLLRLAQRAEAAGFVHAMCSGHCYPWTERGGETGYTWSWLGAALQATRPSFATVSRWPRSRSAGSAVKRLRQVKDDGRGDPHDPEVDRRPTLRTSRLGSGPEAHLAVFEVRPCQG